MGRLGGNPSCSITLSACQSEIMGTASSMPCVVSRMAYSARFPVALSSISRTIQIMMPDFVPMKSARHGGPRPGPGRPDGPQFHGGLLGGPFDRTRVLPRNDEKSKAGLSARCDGRYLSLPLLSRCDNRFLAQAARRAETGQNLVAQESCCEGFGTVAPAVNHQLAAVCIDCDYAGNLGSASIAISWATMPPTALIISAWRLPACLAWSCARG